MPLVKLGATTSTNDFLKELAVDPATENFTVVTAESQSAGRGQMGAVWVSQPGKNLMMSILIKNTLTGANQLFSLNVAVTLAVAEVLERHDIPLVRIKWPNDIMSGNLKIGGILIENSFKSDGRIESVAGIGLNVNQLDFDGLPNAASMHTVTGTVFDKDVIGCEISGRIIRNANFLSEHTDVLWQAYLSKLFKIGVPMPFENPSGERFMGIIKGVTRDGKLQVALEDEKTKTFSLKEIQMLY